MRIRQSTFSNWIGFALSFLFGVYTFSLFQAHAEEPDATETPLADSPAPSPKASSAKKAVKKAKGKGNREKETDGSEALDRFEADTVIKSKYHFNGEPLEVDPD